MNGDGRPARRLLVVLRLFVGFVHPHPLPLPVALPRTRSLSPRRKHQPLSDRTLQDSDRRRWSVRPLTPPLPGHKFTDNDNRNIVKRSWKRTKFVADELGSRRNYVLLSAFMFLFFFAQACAMSFLAIWLKGHIGLNGVEAGTVFSANFIAAMACQPLYGYVSDRLGLRRHVPVFLACLVLMCGLFFTFVYAPLLRFNLVAGAVVGGLYLGLTFVSGSFALESFVDRVGRRYGFEYSRARLWGSLGFATAALFSGRLYNLDPRINFVLASAAGLLLIPIILATRISDPADAPAAPALTPRESLSVLADRKFWGFMVLILGVTNLYLVYDQQFPVYFASMFPTREEGNVMFGYLNSAQIFLEAALMLVAPLIVMRTGAKRGLLLASAIMVLRIGGSALATGPLTISACKMLHSVELPILAVSIFRYIAYHFDTRFASTVYLVGVSFGHSLGLAVLSPLVGRGYDVIGFPATYALIAGGALVFWIASWFALSPTPRTDARGRPLDVAEPPPPESAPALAQLQPAADVAPFRH
ncbi:oligosaccharide MFS transporter [Sphingomonas floccifaciens]|uniref:Oligosaccharide MFS transporter n=1 Tax=Sphingomonas floccifaciens TaxID=1844115 RepID=A0ABW4NDX3_9SPHN